MNLRFVSSLMLGDNFAEQREALIAALGNAEAEKVSGILQSIKTEYPAFADTINLLVESSVASAVSMVQLLDAEIAAAIERHQETFALVQQLMKEGS